MKRKHYEAGFKGKVALELAKELKTLNEVASEYGVHPGMITKWKNSYWKEYLTYFLIKLQGTYRSRSMTN